MLVFLASGGDCLVTLLITVHQVIFVFQMRDLKAVGKKFMHVLYPRKSNALLRDCEYRGFEDLLHIIGTLSFTAL